MVLTFGLWKPGKQIIILPCRVLKWRLFFIHSFQLVFCLILLKFLLLASLENLVKPKHSSLMDTLPEKRPHKQCCESSSPLCFSSPGRGPGRGPGRWGSPLRAPWFKSCGQGCSQPSHSKVAMTQGERCWLRSLVAGTV